MGAEIKDGNGGTAQLAIDNTSKAARVTLYNSAGVESGGAGVADFGSAGNLGYAVNSTFEFDNVVGYSSIGFNLTVPLGSTIAFEGTMDGTNWESHPFRLASNGFLEETSSNGQYSGSISCHRKIRFRVLTLGTVVGSVVGRVSLNVSTLDSIEKEGTGDYSINVSKGSVLDTFQVNKFGRNTDIDIGTEDIWGIGGTFVPPTSAGVVNFVSSSAADTAVGTGARTISVNGLNSEYNEVTETITLLGAANVPTVNSYFIVHRIIVLTAGTGGTNAGTITGTSTGGGTPVMISVTIGKGQSQFCIYQVPRGYTAYLEKFQGSVNGGALLDLELFAKPSGGVYNLKGTLLLNTTASSYVVKQYDTPMKFTEMTTVKLTGTASANNTDVAGNFDMIVIKN